MKLVSVIHPVEQDGSKSNNDPGNSSPEPWSKHAFKIYDIEWKLLRNFGNNITAKARNKNQKVNERQYKQ